jgi:transcriptional regulator with XRE-family HTH domain
MTHLGNGHYQQRLIELIVAARKDAGLSQTEIANGIDEFQSWISRLENNKRRLKIDEFIRLGAVIGFHPPSLLHRAMTTIRIKENSND